MTELEQLKSMLNRIGAKYETDHRIEDRQIDVALYAGDAPVTGYPGFLNVWIFDINGSLLEIVIAE